MTTPASMQGSKGREGQEGGPDANDEINLGQGGPSQEALPTEPVVKITSFGDVVRAAGGVYPPVVKLPAAATAEKPPTLSYARISKRPAVQLMTHDEALRRLLSTKQLQEILQVVDKNQE